MLKRLSLLLLIFALLALPNAALAQSYYFQLPEKTVNVYWNDDGTVSIDYVYVFQNDPAGHVIDYVDIAMPNSNFDENSVTADVNGNQLTDISRSGYQGSGSGVAVGLGGYSIPPGGTGTLHVYIGRVDKMYELDPSDNNYVSAVFAPNTFNSSIVYGTTNGPVTFHLPTQVKPDEPRWHEAPAGYSSEPETGLDDQGRVMYTWRNPNADPTTVYQLGASFPKVYIPDSAIRRANPFAFLGSIDWGCLIPFGCIGFFALVIGLSALSDSKRKLQYLPPRIAIEGHGIKRGLTAVEAALLLEQPMDKILTMILFGVIKKNAAQVVTRDPLELKVADPLPEGLRPYETEFLRAFQVPKGRERQKAMQDMMVNLVKSLAQSMKGFSRRETVEYYRDITKRAWEQVEASDTPEVKSQKYDEVMEWTMLDRDYERRTRDVFRTGPVFVPIWWGRYDPTFGRTSAPSTSGTPVTGGSRSGGGGVSMPNLPGGQFAASVVGGVQSFAGGVVGNINEFTGRITQQTNPPPKPATTTYRGGGGGGGRSCACACACACAGCACACAGGGR
jgi:hypothetical protein